MALPMRRLVSHTLRVIFGGSLTSILYGPATQGASYAPLTGASHGAATDPQ